MSPNNYRLNGEVVSADVYNKSKYEDLRVRVKKGRKAEILSYAGTQSESLNGFINRAIDEAMERGKGKDGKNAPAKAENTAK